MDRLLDKLNEEDMLSNADTGLYQRSIHGRLGDADAFVSHSWVRSPTVVSHRDGCPPLVLAPL